MSNIQIGGRIRELREIKNYTREAFAEKVDISAKFLYEIETGKKGFSADTLFRIAQALSVSCDYIMMGEDPEHYGSERIVGILESYNPVQICRMEEILTILASICERS